MNVVVVESPAKAKTINKYLGSDFRVLASYGHVRDLPPKDGSVRPEENFSITWQIDPKAKKRLDEIAAALEGSGNLYLATDPDREGEAISWHVQQLLADRKVLNGVKIKRVVFHEITKDAVLTAMANPRELNRELSTPIWRVVRWTTSSVSHCPPFFGVNFRDRDPPGEYNPSRCA